MPALAELRERQKENSLIAIALALPPALSLCQELVGKVGKLTTCQRNRRLY